VQEEIILDICLGDGRKESVVNLVLFVLSHEALILRLTDFSEIRLPNATD